MSCATTAEPIQMPFEMQSLVDPRNHVVDAQTGRGTFRGFSGPLQSTAFWGSELCKMSGQILTTYTSYDLFLRKDVPFAGCNVVLLI